MKTMTYRGYRLVKTSAGWEVLTLAWENLPDYRTFCRMWQAMDYVDRMVNHA